MAERDIEGGIAGGIAGDIAVRVADERDMPAIAALRRSWLEERTGTPVDDPGFEAAFAQWCTAGSEDTTPLFALLADTREAPDEELPHTGVPRDWERRLSAPFIVGEGYGTRGSTIVTLGRDGRVRFIERLFDATGRAAGEGAFDFDIG